MGATLNYDSMTTSFRNFIRAQSSTIDSGIYSSVSTIDIFVPGEVTIWATRFPAISVNLTGTEEVKKSIGTYLMCNDSEVMAKFEVGCHVRDIKSYSAAVIDLQKLTANVASAIRSDMTASGTFNMLTVDGVNFQSTEVSPNKTYHKNSIIYVSGYKYF